jgi:hypothetical protein
VAEPREPGGGSGPALWPWLAFAAALAAALALYFVYPPS